MRASTLLAAACLSSAPRLAAQQQPERQPDTIPAELAAALVSSGSERFVGTLPLFTVGRAPSAFPSSLVPPAPATVVGGFWVGDEGAIVVAYPSRGQSAVARAIQALGAAGWNAPRRVQSGFDPSPKDAGPADEPYALCRGDGVAVLTPSYARSGGSAVHIAYFSEPEGTACDTTPSPRPPASKPASLRIPVLEPPAGMLHAFSTVSEMGPDQAHATLTVQGALSIDQLIAHYVPKLEAAGWTIGPPLSGARFAVRSARATDPAGTVWHGFVLGYVREGGWRELTLRLTAERE